MRAAKLLFLGLLVSVALAGLGQAAPSSEAKAGVLPQPDAAGVYRLGDGVSAPKLVFQVEPEFSEQARKKKMAGKCTVSALVGVDGLVHEAVVTRSIADAVSKKLRSAALSLDEEAKKAVQQYRFQPAIFQGKAVPVHVMIDVDFRSFKGTTANEVLPQRSTSFQNKRDTAALEICIRLYTQIAKRLNCVLGSCISSHVQAPLH